MNSVNNYCKLFKVFESFLSPKKYLTIKLYRVLVCSSNGYTLGLRALGASSGSDCVRFYSDSKGGFKVDKGAKHLKNVLAQRKEKIIDAEQKLRQKREEFLQHIKHQKQNFNEKKELYKKDFIDTKEKIKEKLDDFRENIYTIPNFLCISRIVASPYLGYVIVSEQYNLALALWLIASLTDFLDGWIARKWESQSSKMGSFLDPMADKVLVGTLFITLTYNGLIPILLTALIMARDLVLIIAAIVIRYKSLPPPKTVSRYFEVSNATAQLAPTFVSKVNTFIQLLLVGCTLGAPVFNYVDHPAFYYLWLGTGISTVISGLSYVTSKDTYKYLRKNK